MMYQQFLKTVNKQPSQAVYENYCFELENEGLIWNYNTVLNLSACLLGCFSVSIFPYNNRTDRCKDMD